jgi:hypothetical protein
MRRLCIVYLPLRIRVVVGVKVKMGLCAGCSLAITFGVGCMSNPKPVDTYKVPTRVTFSDTDSTSSDGPVNRCRYLSYF